MGLMMNTKLVRPLKFKKKLPFHWGIVLLAIFAVILGFFKLNSAKTSVGTSGKNTNFGDILALTKTPTAYKTAPGAYELPAAKWVPQTFNNCGPAATSMVLQYFGFNVTQEETKADLRTNPDDKNVFISEISDYLKNDYGIQNKVLYNGNLQTIKTLVANGVYVVVEDWLHPNEDIGHVLIIRGYDDSRGILIADDSYFGVGQEYAYDTWDETQWKPYNREFMPVYTKDKEDLVKAVIGENWDEQTMYRNSVKKNQEDVDRNQNDMYAWFNLGTSYYKLGDYKSAKSAFEKSEKIGWPHRMLWYNIDPVLTYNMLGEYKNAINTANLGLWFNDNYAEMHYEKYIAYKGLGDTKNAEDELQKALELDPEVTKKYQS